MRCKSIQKKLLLQQNLGEKEQGHITSCEKCNAFQQEMIEIKRTFNQTKIKVPEELSQATLVWCKTIIEKQKIKLSLKQKLHLLWQSPKLGIGFSILFLATLLLLIIGLIIQKDNGEVFDFNISLVLTILIQNMIMAIFIPLFYSPFNDKTGSNQNPNYF